MRRVNAILLSRKLPLKIEDLAIFVSTIIALPSAIVAHLGIITEKNLQSANAMNHNVIKVAQKEVVTDALGLLKASIDNLIFASEKIEQNQPLNAIDIGGKLDGLARGIGQALEAENDRHKSVVNGLEQKRKYQ